MAVKFLTELNLQNNKVTLLGTPTLATDAATKGYVDSVAQGLDVKASVKAATTANITLSGTQTIDSVTLVANDRVLVKNQTVPSGNGIYLVKAGAWTKATDADGSNLTEGAFTFVEDGAVNQGRGYVYSATDVWTQFSKATEITAGTGISVDGQTVSISSTYTGQNTITTLGTITAGTWNGSTIDVARGGTGAATLTGYVKGNGTSAMTASAFVPAEEVSGRKLAHTIPSGTLAGAYDISTETLNSTIRAEAIVQIRDNSNNIVYADVNVGSNKVTVTLNATTSEVYKVSIFV